MSILSTLATPDGIALLTMIAGWLGHKARSNAKAATIAQVERYAQIAARSVTMAIRAGVITDHDHAIERGLARFKDLLRAAGLNMDPAHEQRVLTALSDAVTAAGQRELGDQLKLLQATADALLRRMGTPT